MDAERKEIVYDRKLDEAGTVTANQITGYLGPARLYWVDYRPVVGPTPVGLPRSTETAR